MKQQKKIKPEPVLFTAENRQWKVLPEFPDYEISNDGRLRRATAGSNTKIGAHIRVGISTNGYPKYGLTKPNGKRVYRNAHRLVAIAFLPPQPEGKPLVLHDDDNRLNCVYTNLKWGSVKDNSSDAMRHGLVAIGDSHPSRLRPWTRPRGESHKSVKLTDIEVKEIMCDQRTHKQIGISYGVHQSLIGRIKGGQVWKHITNPSYRKMLDQGVSDDR